LYKFETSVPFEVLPLRLDAAIPAPLPMLETLSKIFNGNAIKGHQRCLLNLCNVSKLPALQILLHPWEPNKSQGAWSGKWWGWDTTTILAKRNVIRWHLQRFNENRWRPSTAFPLKRLDNVSSKGSGAWIAASSWMGSSLKQIKVSNWYNYVNFFFLTILGIFGSPLICGYCSL